jgi:hypothetical protein
MKKLLLLLLLFTIQSVTQAQNGGTWTWIHGDTVAGTSNFGTKGISSPSNLPPGRYHPAFWKDLNGNFWVFGNSGGTNLADMWKYNPTINEWTWMSGSNTSAGTGNYGTKGIPSVNNYPPNRGYGASCWTDSVGDLWMYAGSGVTDLWRYNVTTNEWTWMDGGPSTPLRTKNYGVKYISTSSNFPGAKSECKSNWVHNNELIFCVGDVWSYSIANNEWTWIGGDSFASAAVIGSIGVPSSSNHPGWGWSYTKWKYKDKLYLYGGGVAKENIWSFNLTTKLFTCELNPSSSIMIPPPSNCLHTPGYFPGKRDEYHTIQTSDCNRSYWTYGGFSGTWGGTSMADLWLYNMDLNYWIRVSNGSSNGTWGNKGISNPSNHPPEKAGFGIWNDESGNLYLFSGFKKTNDLWKFEPDPACLGSISLVGN